MIEGLNFAWQTALSSDCVPWTAPWLIIKKGSLVSSAGPYLMPLQMCFCWQIEVHYWPLFTHTKIEQQASPNTVLKKHDCSFDDITAASGRFLHFDFKLTHRYSSSALCWLCWFICLFMQIWEDLKSVNCFLFSGTEVWGVTWCDSTMMSLYNFTLAVYTVQMITLCSKDSLILISF